jgi:hypothetical protein
MNSDLNAKMNKYEFKIEKCVDISEALCERDRYCFNCGNIQNKKWDSCQKCHHTHIDEEGLHSIEISDEYGDKELTIAERKKRLK